MLKISVIIPVYNVEKYIKKCILSVVDQSYKNFEILIIDDGSTDNSIKMIEDIVLENKNINVYRKENGGLSSARNFGLEKASGDYILFVDSDDWIEKDLFKILVENLIDEDILIYNLGEYNNKENKVVTSKKIRNIKKELLRVNEGYKFLDEVPNGVWLKCYKTSFIKQNNFRFNEELKLYEDTYWDIITLVNAKKVRFLDYVGYWYRTAREGSLITNLTKEKNIKYRSMVKKLLLNLENKNISNFAKKKLKLLILNLNFELGEIESFLLEKELINFIRENIEKSEIEENLILKKYLKNKIRDILERNVDKINIFIGVYIYNNLVTVKSFRRKSIQLVKIFYKKLFY